MAVMITSSANSIWPLIAVRPPIMQRLPITVLPAIPAQPAMAQATALYGELAVTEGMDKDILYYLVGIDKARFRQTVGPGDQLILRVDFITVKRNIWKFSTTATVDDKLVASAVLMTTPAESQS